MTGFIILILVGLFLFVVEFLLIPGVTVAGIGGLASLVGGVFWAYHSFGNTVGHITLFSTVFLTLLTVTLALRSKTWKKFMLNTNIEGSVGDNNEDLGINPGDEGISVSRLSPMGKVRINDKVIEAKSLGEYIDSREDIIVIRIEGAVAIVKLKNN
ncbi:MAG: NfeD family protein [Bacteroidales bacterium]|jgi:membrane-bound ClpP family serine protease|nr:NfeD family protein [Bacteroidales bacterium]MDD4673315.1 NfeD family protein [Bacteroidales bacterium]MDY0348604.1 NfeD family protein [Tenuifilaceae bacterium]